VMPHGSNVRMLAGVALMAAVAVADAG
jgi:hypothetical protein